MARIRSRTNVPITGTFWRQHIATGSLSSGTTGLQTTYLTDRSEDEVHSPPFEDDADRLYLRKMKYKPARVSHRWKASNGYKYWGYHIPARPAGALPTVYIEWQHLLNAALARIQDNEPIVDIPLALGELKDLPKLIDKAREMLRKLHLTHGADAWLIYHWAIKPVINDMVGLTSLQKEIANTMARHRKKFRSKRARGKLPPLFGLLTSGAASSARPVAYGVNCTLYHTPFSKGAAWYCARIEPMNSIPELYAQHATVGKNLGFGDSRRLLSVAYNLLPWSWLIDYFTGLGSLIEMYSNRQIYKVTRVDVMVTHHWGQKLHPVFTFPIGSSETYLHTSDGEEGRVEKHREIYHNPSAKLAFSPLLSGGQLANLAALAVSLSANNNRLSSLGR